MVEQLSLFDIELDVVNAHPEEEIIPERPEHNKINMARVPDEQYKEKLNLKFVPSVDRILKLLDRELYKVNTHEFLSDVFEIGAIAISNKFDHIRAEKREKTYLQIINKYDKETQNTIVSVFTEIFLLLTNQYLLGFNDYLGEFYIGQTMYAPVFRWGQHLKTGRFPISNITDYKFEVIEIVPKSENILEREKYYIQKFYKDNPKLSLNIACTANIEPDLCIPEKIKSELVEVEK